MIPFVQATSSVSTQRFPAVWQQNPRMVPALGIPRPSDAAASSPAPGGAGGGDARPSRQGAGGVGRRRGLEPAVADRRPPRQHPLLVVAQPVRAVLQDVRRDRRLRAEERKVRVLLLSSCEGSAGLEWPISYYGHLLLA